MDTPVSSCVVEQRGRAFRITDDPVAVAAAREFADGLEEGTLRFFDAVLPDCGRMIDFGAYFGFTALYAATAVPEIYAFEPSPTNFAMMVENVLRNPDLSGRMHLFEHGLADRDAEAMLFARPGGDYGSSLFQTVERGSTVNTERDTIVTLRAADTVLREIGLNARTLLKIDIQGAEYVVLPAIADLLAECRPYLHIAFHPSNIVLGNDEYVNTIERIRCSMQVAEALAPYRYMHLFSDGNWFRVAQADRMDFLRQYLLRPKQLPLVATPQYGFVGAVAFSDLLLPLLYVP